MLAQRRHDVADLNQRARDALRELGWIGGDQLVTDSRAFAVGDRVVARRNDRRLGVVNGETGHVVAIVDGCAAVTLDDGRMVELTEAYARAGHLDHGYALTAHLAQGATVERAFVLGSDELYREWGYTALSRHTMEARFYVSATPPFLNRSDQSLHVGRGTTRQVARMLGASRAQRLALDGTTPDPQRSLMVDELDEVRRHLAMIDAEVAALERARDRLRWYERGRRGELLRRIDDHGLLLGHGQADVERLTIELACRSDPEQLRLSRAIDPLSRIEPRARDMSRDHGRGIER